jgi:uncharacterized protein involved in exopolysaccharide biosynthesis
LDKAVPPERKSGPHRAIIVVAVTVLALLVAVLIAFFMEGLEKAKEDLQFAGKLQLFGFYLRGGHNKS